MSTKHWDPNEHYLPENWTARDLWQSVPRFVKVTFIVIALVFLANLVLFLAVTP